MSADRFDDLNAVLVIPHLRIQNANAISSQHTWGFPAISAFTGLMVALERKLGPDSGVQFHGVGVVCHSFQTQTNGRYIRRFNLTRNPVKKTGEPSSMIEEGRVHLEITLIFGLDMEPRHQGDANQKALAQKITETLESLRVAGGSIMPHLSRSRQSSYIEILALDSEQRHHSFRKLRRRWLPGFALVARDDLLTLHLAELRKTQPDASAVDAWLDRSRTNYQCVSEENVEKGDAVWESTRSAGSGWVVPIPVGYTALKPLQEPGTVRNARDMETPFRFVESIYSLGEWLGPHRLNSLSDLLWYPAYDPERGRYEVRNHFLATPQSVTSVVPSSQYSPGALA